MPFAQEVHANDLRQLALGINDAPRQRVSKSNNPDGSKPLSH
jgi:hypothetical protein